MEWHFYFFSPGPHFICSDPDGAIGFKYKSVSALTPLPCFCHYVCVHAFMHLYSLLCVCVHNKSICVKEAVCVLFILR